MVKHKIAHNVKVIQSRLNFHNKDKQTGFLEKRPQINVYFTFPEISIPISSKTCVTMASCSSSSPDSVKISSKVSLTETNEKR